MIFYDFDDSNLPDVCCVYLIYNRSTQRFYVGSTVNLRSRIKSHKVLLKKNEHHSEKLQRSFNKHGEHNFSVVIACLAKEECVRSIESVWLRCKSLTYNASSQVGGNGKENRSVYWYTANESKVFSSTKEAADAIYGNKRKHTKVAKSARNMHKTNGGYFSFSESSFEGILYKKKNKPKKKYQLKNPRKVFAFHPDGKLVNVFRDYREAEKELKVSRSAVLNVLSKIGYSKTVNGLHLSYDHKFSGFDNYGCKKPVLQKLNGLLVRRFDSTLSAANEFSVTDSTVSRWCRGMRARNGFEWEYEAT